MIFQATSGSTSSRSAIVFQRTFTAMAGIVVLQPGGGVVAASSCSRRERSPGSRSREVIGAAARPAARRGRSRALAAAATTGVPIGVAVLLFILLLRLDVTLLSFIAGEEEVGVYAAAFRLVESTQFIAWAMSAAMMPWLRADRGGRAGRAATSSG